MLTILVLAFKSLLSKGITTLAIPIIGGMLSIIAALIATWGRLISLKPKQFFYGFLYTVLIVFAIMWIKEIRHLVKTGKKELKAASQAAKFQFTKEQRDKRKAEFEAMLKKRAEEQHKAFKKEWKNYKEWLKDCNKNLTDKELFSNKGLKICNRENFDKQLSP